MSCNRNWNLTQHYMENRKIIIVVLSSTLKRISVSNLPIWMGCRAFHLHNFSCLFSVLQWIEFQFHLTDKCKSVNTISVQIFSPRWRPQKTDVDIAFAFDLFSSSLSSSTTKLLLALLTTKKLNLLKVIDTKFCINT